MSWDDEKLGYGRPPSWTKFKKGTSGNPKGRPRRTQPNANVPAQSNLDDLLRAALNRTIPITDRGVSRLITAIELILQRQIADAGKGSILAQRDILFAARELEARDRVRAAVEAELDVIVFNDVLERRDKRARVWQEAAARGTEPDQPWPHPDDFIIDRATRSWYVRGPNSTADVRFYDGLRADRDVMLLHSVLYVRQGRRGLPLAKFYVNLFMIYDLMLPLRWQAGENGWEDYARALIGLPMPVLRKILAHFERAARDIVRPQLTAQQQKDVYKVTNRVMKPILRKQGFRTLKQFEAAYAELGPAELDRRSRQNAGRGLLRK
jgi:hypothetical protein